MGNIVLLLFCFGAGLILRQTGRLPDNASVVLNGVIINIGLPALALAYLRDIEFGGVLLYAALGPWILFLVGAPLIWAACRAMRFTRATTGCLILVGGMANTSFMGIPLIEAYYGTAYLGVGVVADQLGSYLVLSLLGIGVARYFAEGARPAFREVAMRIVTFPPFIATVAALALMGVPYPGWLEGLLDRLAILVAPLALLSVGFQLRFSALSGRALPLTMGLGYKLILGPLIVLAVFVWLSGLRGTEIQVAIFEVAMAPMIGASIVAMENDLDPQLASLLVGIGVPLSFITLAIWHPLLSGI